MRRSAPTTQRGFLLITVVLILGVLAAMALMLSTSTSLDNALVAKHAEGATLDYLTESGMQHAEWQLAQNGSCTGYTNLPSTVLGNHSYSATVTPTSGSPVSVVANGTLANGTTRARTHNDVKTYQLPNVVILQPGSEGKDTYIGDRMNPDTNKNFGATSQLRVSVGSYHTMIHFDLSPIPTGARITSAILELNFEAADDLSTADISAHQLTRAWNEGTQGGTGATAVTGANWNTYDAVNPWDSPGGDFVAASSATSTVTDSPNTPFSWNITNLTRRWHSGIAVNHGIILKVESGNAVNVRFTSSDSPSTAQHPKLTITYACECGKICTVDPPTGSLLMVVANPTSLTAEESAKKTLIESWDYAVTLIDDSSSQLDLDKAADLNDVVYVPEDIDHTQLKDKLRNTATGIVVEEQYLFQEFGFSGSRTQKLESQIDIVDNSHYITSDFTLGLLNIYTSDQLSSMVINPAIGTQTLAEMNNTGPNWDPTVAIIETGSEMYGGGPAPARRAKLPFQSIAALNENGQTLMRRAIEWGAGAGGSATLGLIAHWKLDDGAGFTAIDSEGGHNGTLKNGPVWSDGGVIAGALDFDGANDYLDVPHDETMSLTSAFTISAWVRNDSPSISGAYRILSKESNGANDNYWLAFENKTFWVGIGGSFYSAPTAFEPDIWYHLAVSFDDATDQLVIYVNGIAVSSITTTATLTPNSDPLFIGTNWQGTKLWDGLLDDVRIYDKVLDVAEVADLSTASGGSGGGGPGYNETYAPWSATSNSTWQPADLAPFGVPANAVVEVAVVNSNTGSELWGGVRAVGSTLDRRLQLHEAESGGTDVMIMHVQADAASRIEHYSDITSDVTFVLLGYWATGTYVERMDFFSAAVSNLWHDRDLAPFGVSSGQTAEIIMTNVSTSRESMGGVRSVGSSLDRRVNLHEAEGEGEDMATMLVNADGSPNATIQVYAEAVVENRFFLVGYWSTPPGEYTENFVELSGAPASSGAWKDEDLTSLRVPANAVVQILMANGEDMAEGALGIREKGSGLDRTLNLHEAEDGGDDLVSLHVNTDGGSGIQWYDENTSRDHRFYLLGWWVLTP